MLTRKSEEMAYIKRPPWYIEKSCWNAWSRSMMMVAWVIIMYSCCVCTSNRWGCIHKNTAQTPNWCNNRIEKRVNKKTRAFRKCSFTNVLSRNWQTYLTATGAFTCLFDIQKHHKHVSSNVCLIKKSLQSGPINYRLKTIMSFYRFKPRL